MEIKTSKTYKGTRIVFGETARNKRRLLNQMIEIMESYGYQEMMIPVIQLTETFASKVGEENTYMMYTFISLGKSVNHFVIFFTYFTSECFS